MEEKANNQLVKDTEEVVSWRRLNQDEIDEVLKKLAVKIEEEVLGNYKVEDSKRVSL